MSRRRPTCCALDVAMGRRSAPRRVLVEKLTWASAHGSECPMMPVRRVLHRPHSYPIPSSVQQRICTVCRSWTRLRCDLTHSTLDFSWSRRDRGLPACATILPRSLQVVGPKSAFDPPLECLGADAGYYVAPVASYCAIGALGNSVVLAETRGITDTFKSGLYSRHVVRILRPRRPTLTTLPPDRQEEDDGVVDLLPVVPVWAGPDDAADQLPGSRVAGEDLQAPAGYLRCVGIPARLGLQDAARDCGRAWRVPHGGYCTHERAGCRW